MYAVIETGGKQYKADKGAFLRLEKLAGEVGKTLELDRVLLIHNESGTQLGKPIIAGAKVVAQVVRQGRARKVISYKYLPRKHSEKLKGHRQYYTQVKIMDIQTGKEV